MANDSDQNKEDEVLKRMLRTPHKKHESLTLGKAKKKRLTKKDGDTGSSGNRGDS